MCRLSGREFTARKLGPVVLGRALARFWENKRNRRAVFPEALERIVHTVFFVEDVNYEVAEVQQNPTTLRATLATKRFGSALEELVFDLTGDCDNVAFVAAGGEEKDICERQGPGDVEGNEVLGLLGVGGD